MSATSVKRSEPPGIRRGRGETHRKSLRRWRRLQRLRGCVASDFPALSRHVLNVRVFRGQHGHPGWLESWKDFRSELLQEPDRKHGLEFSVVRRFETHSLRR